jgi:hypothetical protein
MTTDLRPLCENCGRTVSLSNLVMLELDQRINEYHDFCHVPESWSQGWFPFGSDCANNLRERARVKLIARKSDPSPDPSL